MKIIGTGLSGLVGTYLTKSLSPEFNFENLSLDTGVDITEADVVEQRISQSDAPWVFHLAAKTNVDQAEKERGLGREGDTWKVNVIATENIVQACEKYKKKLLYISTDFVFSGGTHVFKEEDTPNPIGWYAETKFEGEKRIASLGKNGLIVRISFPYGSVNGPRHDFVGKIKELLQHGKIVISPVDQIFVPTHLEDIAQGIKTLIEKNLSGIYHIVGPKGISSYNAAITIAEVFGYNSSLIQKTTVKEYYRDRAPRAFQLIISNGKIAGLGINTMDFSTGIKLFKENLTKNLKII